MSDRLRRAIKNLLQDGDDTGCDGTMVVDRQLFDNLLEAFEAEELGQ